MVKYKPSNLACSAIYLVNKITKMQDGWPEALANESNYSEADVKDCARDFFRLLKQQERSQLTAANRKYRRDEYDRVSNI